MNQNRFLNITVLFALFLQTTLFQVALPSLVLCLGDDGHIALEWLPGATHCAFETNPPENTVNNNHCASASDITQEFSCTDINLHFHTSFANKSQKNALPNLFGSAGLPVLTRVKNSDHLKIARSDNPISPAFITAAIQSTVLLI